MSDKTLNRYLQDLGTGDALALGLKEYAGLVLTAYPTATKIARYIWKKNITEGKSYQFPAVWKMSNSNHTPGAELTGSNEPLTEERTVLLDTAERVSHAWITELDEFISHFERRQDVAREAAQSLAERMDELAFRCIALGARTAARGPSNEFPSGVTLASPRVGADLAAVYPVSTAGSTALQDDLGEIAQGMDERDVPQEGRVAFICPYLQRVLLQDKTLVSRDYVDPNTNQLVTRVVSRVQGFEIVVSNIVRQGRLNVTSDFTQYNGDFRYTAAVCLGDRTGVGQVTFGGIRPFGPTWVEDHLSWLIGARMLQGMKWIRPEACGEITYSTS